MKNAILLFTLGCFFLFFLNESASAEDDTIRAVFVTWQPYGYVENGKIAGFELDTFAAVAKQMEMRVEFRERPWKRCLYLVENGLADVVISALKTKEREKYMIYPNEHISINNTALFTTVERDFEFDETFESLKGYIIGTTAGFSYGKNFDKATFLKKDGNTKTEAIVSKLIMQRYDLGIGNIPVISSIAHKQGNLKRIKFLNPLVHSQKLYASFSRKNQLEPLAKRFSNELKVFKTTETYEKILAKYGMSLRSQNP